MGKFYQLLVHLAILRPCKTLGGTQCAVETVRDRACVCLIEVKICAIINKDEAIELRSTLCGLKGWTLG